MKMFLEMFLPCICRFSNSRLKLFVEDGEKEMMNEQIMILQITEALDWKLVHEADSWINQKGSLNLDAAASGEANLLISSQVPGGKAINPNVTKAVEVARQHGILVIWVVRGHDPMGRDVEIFRLHLYGKDKETPLVKKRSVGAELVDDLEI
ncbi:uncharacterized protein LOC122064158 isoform X2 [Macadamia integrifolia]|nr:uncharacterized protein LOC122064158 isoform X2 [Macadamia integrifolia]XP_042483800.1 uncharacterized protein LOC122064158 isoform X2 [Macadamia integrifolia]